MVSVQFSRVISIVFFPLSLFPGSFSSRSKKNTHMAALRKKLVIVGDGACGTSTNFRFLNHKKRSFGFFFVR